MAKDSIQGQYLEKETTLDKIKPGPYQVRREFDREKMAELVQSIQENTLINPPVVFAENGHYRLLIGERRSRALCAMALATDLVPMPEAIELVCREDTWDVLESYPVLGRFGIKIRVAPDDLDLEAISIVENLQRVDLNPIEEGQAYRLLLKKYKTLTRVSRVTGRATALIKMRMAMLNLEEEIQGYITKGKLSKDTRVIESLLSLPTTEIRLQLARRFVERGTTIKAIVSACEKVKKALVQTIPAARPVASVPVSQVVIKPAAPARPVTAPIPPLRCFCPDCADLIQSLAEELCGDCRSKGLTAKCLHCPGVIEFVEALIKRVERHA